MTRIIVDADALAYTCGFASQAVVYDWSFIKDGEVIDEGITNDKSYLGFLEIERPFGTAFQYVPLVEAQPLVNALAMVKKVLLAIEQTLDAEEVEFKRLELCLTGTGNFREQIATIKGYKANRVGIEKPVHYAAIRRYMKERWNAEVVNGMEADDMLAIIAASENYDPERVIIVSMDKDLMTVPGRLYNFKRKRFYHITEEQALINFYRQCLTGDVVDNIGGAFKCGEKGAETLIHLGMTELEMYQSVLGEYEASLKRKGCPYTHMTAEEALLENGRLLHMSRWPGNLWSPPTARDSSAQLDMLSDPSPSTKPLSTTSTSPKQDEPAVPAEKPSTSSDDLPTSPTLRSAQRRTLRQKGG